MLSYRTVVTAYVRCGSHHNTITGKPYSLRNLHVVFEAGIALSVALAFSSSYAPAQFPILTCCLYLHLTRTRALPSVCLSVSVIALNAFCL